MIDKFQRIAQITQILLVPSIVVGFICLISMVIIVLNVGSGEGNRYLMPSFIGLIWALATYSFIVTFRNVPEKACRSQTFVGRMRRRVSRSWYWLIALVFLGTTGTALIFTVRLISIWLRDYGG